MDKFLLLRVGWWRTNIGSKAIYSRSAKGLNCSAEPHLAYIHTSEAGGFTLDFGKGSTKQESTTNGLVLSRRTSKAYYPRLIVMH